MNRLHLALLALLLIALSVLVPSPALVDGAFGVSAYGVCVAVAAAAAILLAAVLRRGSGLQRVPLLKLALFCTAAAFAGARALFCAFRMEVFVAWLGPAAILTPWTGGFMLYGAVLAASLAAALLARASMLTRMPGQMLPPT